MKMNGASDADIQDFKTKAPLGERKLLENWQDYDVYLGELADASGMHILLDYRDDGITPYCTFWKSGLKAKTV